jgi:hypothetical protein
MTKKSILTKRSVLMFAICLIVLLGLQTKYLLPMMYDIAASDLFLVDSKDSASPLPIANDMTALAFSQCNASIKKQLGEEKPASFAAQPTNVWSLGNYDYVVNADVEIAGKDAPGAMHHYVCRIQYTNGDDLSGAMNQDNWSLMGLSGLTE